MQTQSRNALDAKLVHNIMDSVTDVLGTMAGTTVTLKDVVPLQDFKPQGDISSVIGISGETGEGMMALSFTEELTKVMVGRLLGLPPEEVEKDDLVDGVGELINMISGRAKVALSNECNTVYRLSLPSIILGKKHEIVGKAKNIPYLLLFFDAAGETFHLQVTFRIFES